LRGGGGRAPQKLAEPPGEVAELFRLRPQQSEVDHGKPALPTFREVVLQPEMRGARMQPSFRPGPFLKQRPELRSGEERRGRREIPRQLPPATLAIREEQQIRPVRSGSQ